MAFHVVENCIKLEFTVLDLLSLKFKTYKLVDFIMIITGRSYGVWMWGSRQKLNSLLTAAEAPC